MSGHAILSPSGSGVRDRSGQAVHTRLYQKWGYAKEHLCISCFGGENEIRNGSAPWSSNLDDYAPMCRSCHALFDRMNDTEMADRVVAVLKSVPSELRQKAGNTFAEKRRTDPEFRAACEEQQRGIASLGGRAIWNNPESAARMRAVLTAAARRRWVCDECGYVSNAPVVQRHLNRTGHLGRREINV